MFAEHFRREADGLVGGQRAVGIDIQSQFVIIGDLPDTGILHRHVDALNRRINRIHGDHANRKIFRLVPLGADIAAAARDRNFRVKLGIFSTAAGSDDMLRIHDFDVGIHLDIGRRHDALSLKLNVSDLRLVGVTVVLDCQPFQVRNDFRHILLDAGDGTELVKHAVNLHLADCYARQGRQHDSAQGIAQSGAIAPLQGFYYKSAVFFIFRNLNDFDVGFFKFKHDSTPSFWVVDCLGMS